MPTRPPILQRGDTIGIVTLGSPLGANTINARIENFLNQTDPEPTGDAHDQSGSGKRYRTACWR